MSGHTPSLSSTILDVLRDVVGAPRETIVPLHAPTFTARDAELVQNCLTSTFVSSVGQYVDRFEAALAAYTGAAHAVAVVNGTAALQVALTVAGVKRDDEVLIPALSFVATANAVAHCGAVPHFVDSSERTLGMDPEALERYLSDVVQLTPDGAINRLTRRRIAAVVPMHTFGHPVEMVRLVEVAAQFRLVVIEDAAESLGSTYRGRHAGTFGQLATLSFNGNKIVTTGGGGAILTSDPDLAQRAKHLTTTAKRPHRWAFEHDAIAWNFRLPNLNAALGCAQMERLPELVASKRELARRYQDAFDGCDGVRFVREPDDTCSNYWLNTIMLQAADADERDRVLQVTNDAGYQCRPVWRLLHTLPMFVQCPRADLPVARRLEATLINLPSSPSLVGQ